MVDVTDELDGRARRAAEVREQRRRQILDAALEVFAAKGYHDTSISDLVAAVGVARGTFYLYFESKEAIFLDLLDELLGELRASVRGVDPREGAPGFEAQLVAITKRILTTAADNHALARVIFREAVGLDAAVDARLTAFYADLHEWLVRSLGLGQALGMVRADLDRPVAAWSIVGGLREVVQRLIMQEVVDVDVDAVARAVVSYHTRALS